MRCKQHAIDRRNVKAWLHFALSLREISYITLKTSCLSLLQRALQEKDRRTSLRVNTDATRPHTLQSTVAELVAIKSGAGHFGIKTLWDTSAPQNWRRSLRRITGEAVSHRNCPWVEVSRLFLDHGTRVEVSRTTFLVSKCLEIGAEVSQSVLMPKCLVAEVSGRPYVTCADYENECVALYLAAIRQKEHSAV